MLKTANMVRETTTSTGTGALVLAGVPSARYQTVVGSIGVGHTAVLKVEMGEVWEIGIWEVTDDAPDTITPVTLIQSTTGSKIDWAAGTKAVRCVPAAEQIRPIVTALPASPIDGQSVILRVGATPFSFMEMVYDATYEKWVSTQVWTVQGSAADATVTAPDSTIVIVTGSTIRINQYDALYDLGLRPQVRIWGRYGNNNTTGVTRVFVLLATGTEDTNVVTDRGDITGKTRPTGSTTNLNFSTDWQDFSASDPVDDTRAELSLRLARTVAGTAICLGGRGYQIRFVAAVT